MYMMLFDMNGELPKINRNSMILVFLKYMKNTYALIASEQWT